MSDLVEKYAAMSHEEKNKFMNQVELAVMLLGSIPLIKEVKVIMPQGEDVYMVNADEETTRTFFSQVHTGQETDYNGPGIAKDSCNALMDIFAEASAAYSQSLRECACGNSFFIHHGIKYMGGVYCSSECATKNAKKIDEE